MKNIANQVEDAQQRIIEENRKIEKMSFDLMETIVNEQGLIGIEFSPEERNAVVRKMVDGEVKTVVFNINIESSDRKEVNAVIIEDSGSVKAVDSIYELGFFKDANRLKEQIYYYIVVQSDLLDLSRFVNFNN